MTWFECSKAMTSDSLVSIIPVYNRGNSLRKAADGPLAQIYNNIEALDVNGASNGVDFSTSNFGIRKAFCQLTSGLRTGI